MGCAPSKASQYASQPPDGAGESYTKTLLSPGGTLQRVAGFAIDTTLPLRTPGGSAASRRDYDRDPLTFEEVAAIEQARERARYLARTPKMLASSWRKIVLQAPGASTPIPDDGDIRPGLSVFAEDGQPSGVPDPAAEQQARDGDSVEQNCTQSGRREIRVPLPADCTGGEELVVETPRGTLVDVTVPQWISLGSDDGSPRTIAVLYHPNAHAAVPTPRTPMTPIMLTSPPKGKRARGADADAGAAEAD